MIHVHIVKSKKILRAYIQVCSLIDHIYIQQDFLITIKICDLNSSLTPFVSSFRRPTVWNKLFTESERSYADNVVFKTKI